MGSFGARQHGSLMGLPAHRTPATANGSCDEQRCAGSLRLDAHTLHGDVPEYPVDNVDSGSAASPRL